MTDLLNDIESLRALIKQLLRENAQLKAENAELRRRLGLDSTNSHKPPSSDGYKKKRNYLPYAFPRAAWEREGGSYPTANLDATRDVKNALTEAA